MLTVQWHPFDFAEPQGGQGQRDVMGRVAAVEHFVDLDVRQLRLRDDSGDAIPNPRDAVADEGDAERLGDCEIRW